MLSFLLLAWVVLLAALIAFAIGSPRQGGALTLAYFLGLSLIHVPGALAFSTGLPFTSTYGLSNRAATQPGFEMTLIGVTALVVGAILARAIDNRPIATNHDLFSHSHLGAFERVGRRS